MKFAPDELYNSVCSVCERVTVDNNGMQLLLVHTGNEKLCAHKKVNLFIRLLNLIFVLKILTSFGIIDFRLLMQPRALLEEE